MSWLSREKQYDTQPSGWGSTPPVLCTWKTECPIVLDQSFNQKSNSFFFIMFSGFSCCSDAIPAIAIEITSGEWAGGSPRTPQKAKLLDNGHVSKFFCLVLTSVAHTSTVFKKILSVLESTLNGRTIFSPPFPFKSDGMGPSTLLTRLRHRL